MTQLKEIAKEAGVSINTVSRVLNGMNKESWPGIAERAERIREIAKRLGYRPNSAARAMRTKKSHHIGVLMSGQWTTPYEFPVVMGLNETLQAAGYSLSIINAAEIDPAHPDDALVFREQILSGIFIMHVEPTLANYARSITQESIELDSNIRTPQNCIFRDEFYSGKLASEKLIELGYERIIFVSIKQWANCHVHVIDRVLGAQEAVKEKNKCIEIHEINTAVRGTAMNPSEINEATENLFRGLKPSDAILTSDLELAQLIANTANMKGLCPGHDFAIASCSDMFSCAMVWPWLSRISFDRIELGKRAAEMMLHLLGGNGNHSSIKLRGEWIAGKTAPPRHSISDKFAGDRQ